LSDAVTAAGAVLGRDLTVVDQLGGSLRNDVWRAGDGAGTVVVKQHKEKGNPWRRESRGLRAAEPTGVAPRLLGTDDDRGVLVMEDLGGGPTVADALLSRDRDRARRLLGAWAEAAADLHAGTVGLAVDDPEADEMPGIVAESADELAELAERVGVDGSAARLLVEVAEPLRAGEHTALSAGDMCPDNNAEVGGRLRLFDFEFADVRHPAWDASYLRVPWPSCWCAWRVPGDETARALEHYRERLTPSLAYVGTGAFERDVDTAVLVWCLITCAWFLPAALDDDPPPRRSAAPRRKPLVLHRLRHATTLPAPEPLHALARDLRGALVDRWGEHDLALAPAFR
jgi:hypothetical protein